MNYSIHRFESVASTNDTAARMAEDGVPEGTVVIAAEQVAGRGRHGRHWTSPQNEGLYLSIVLRPDVPAKDLWQLAFVASVAVADAVRQVSGLAPGIKWPNDVLLNGRKMCGILVESPRINVQRPTSNAQRSTGRPVVVGIGMNLNNSEFPPEIAEKATSIMLETGDPVSPKLVEEALLAHLDAVYSEYLTKGFVPILGRWKSLDCTSGRHVSVVTGDGIISGTAADVDADGDLLVRRDDGTIARITAGEVILT